MHRRSYELAIVVVNYQTPQLVIDCLESLLIDIDSSNAAVVVVDNRSGDNSADLIEEWLNRHGGERCHLIRSDTNNGFSSGNNIGIESVSADYFLLLNSDTIVRPNAIKILLDTAKNNAAVGLIGPRLEWADAKPQESCFRYHTPFSELIGSAKTSVVTKLLTRFVVPQQVSEMTQYYDWLSFACVLVRSDVFSRIGLMDDGYFMYFEDVEFCRRAVREGWRLMYQPAAHVVHLRGGSSPLKAMAKQRKRLPRYFYESRTRFFYQAYGRSGLLAANLLWTIGALIAVFRKLLSSSYIPDIAEKQWSDIWINFSNPLKHYVHPDDYDKT